MATRVMEGERLGHEEGLAILRSGDDQLLDLLAAAYRVRHRFFGNRVHLNHLINARSGRCGEDCGYCSQSKVSRAEIPQYGLLPPEQIVDGAHRAALCRARTYCIAISGRSPTPQDLDAIAALVPRIKATFPLKVCVSPGLLTQEQAARLKAVGVDRVNHNLNTSRRFYSAICTTHTYDERLATLREVRAAGLEICSGGIVGMGEEDADVIELALRLGELAVEALPVNFFQPIPGTPLGGTGQGEGADTLAHGDGPGVEGASLDPADAKTATVADRLNPRYCLKVLALFRLANPGGELRIAAGREMHLGPLQPLGLYPANSVFVGDYLTTKGQPPSDDFRMIEALGFEPVVGGG